METPLWQELNTRARQLNSRGDILDTYTLAMFAHYLDGIKGKKILDVGCGGDYTLTFGSGDRGTNYPPNFLRLAKSHGAIAVGLDPTINPDKEDLEAHQGYVEDIGNIFESGSFDGVLVKLLYNAPDIDLGRPSGYPMHLQREAYKQIHRILKPGGVSVSVMNADMQHGITVPIQEFFKSLGFEIELYSPGKNSYDDIVVVRKPLSVV